VKEAQVHELLYQALETELGGVQVYTKAIECAVNDDLREEWNKYLDETKTHVEIMTKVFADLGLDAEKETPGRKIVRFKGESLIKSMDMAWRRATRALPNWSPPRLWSMPRPRIMPTGN